MIIKNGLVYTENFRFQRKNIRVKERRIIAVTAEELIPESGEEIVQAEGKKILPGLVDLHLHGCGGYDLSDASDSALHAMARYEASAGVAAFCPMAMTLPEKRTRKVCETAAAYCPEEKEAEIVGIGLEGPFLSKNRAGAQNPENVKLPDGELLSRWIDAAGGKIMLMTIAPELPGALELIRRYRDRVRFSLGHTEADYETAAKAYRAGALQLTHAYDAMPPLTHRAPGPIGAAADAPDVMAELICDGHHVHPSAVRAAFRIFGAERMILISDSTRACGMPDGQYELGGLPIIKKDGAARLADGTLAGSVTNLFDCMVNAIRMGIPEEDAIRAASYNPAAALGIQNDFGIIAEGASARMVLADADYGSIKVIM